MIVGTLWATSTIAVYRTIHPVKPLKPWDIVP